MFRNDVSVGRGTDGYTGFGRHCLRGAKCNTLSHAFGENLDETDMSLFKAIWLLMFLNETLSRICRVRGLRSLFGLQLKCGSYPAEQHQTQPHLFITYFSGL